MMYSGQWGDGTMQRAWLPAESIRPRPSLNYREESTGTLAELAASIRMQGMLRPLLVRRCGAGRYQVESGNRRLMACRMLGLTMVEACILPERPSACSPARLMQNLGHPGLHYLEAAEILQELQQRHGLSLHELAEVTGAQEQLLLDRLELAGLDAELRLALMEEGIPERMARALLRLPEGPPRLQLLRRIVREGLCIRDVELLAASAARKAPQPPKETHHPDAPPPSALPPRPRLITLVRDVRPYINAVRDIAGQLQAAGVQASLTERQTGSRVEVTLAVPTRRRRADRHRVRQSV